MKIGIDTNVLIHAHLPGLERHEEARAFVQRRLEEPDVILVVTPLVLHELVHVITDTRRFDPPVSMSEAVEVSRGYLDRSNVECIASDEPSLLLAFDLLTRHALGLKRVADTLLAATLIHHDVGRLATYNPSDFAVFAEIRAFEPAPVD